LGAVLALDLPDLDALDITHALGAHVTPRGTALRRDHVQRDALFT
jgi:hypothetical protein